MQILVFKTNLTDNSHINDVEASLDEHPQIHQWNVDRHDIDNILRVVSHGIAGEEVEALVSGAGYYCEELKD